MRGWQCKECHRSFQSYGNLLHHRHTHSMSRLFKCRKENCYKAFRTLTLYQSHYRWHVNKRLYHCAGCRKGFLFKSHLILHRCLLVNRERYKCHVCPHRFQEALSFAHHLKIKHPYLKRKQRATSSQKEASVPKNKNEDNKILLKITAGKSMTIISPSKESSHQKNRKTKVKKSKHKHKDAVQKNGIILSIKKKLLNMSGISQNKLSKQTPASPLNGVVNRIVEPCSTGGNLKMKIKTLPEKSASPTLLEKLNTNSYPSSPSYSRKTAKSVSCLSDTEMKNSSKFRTSVSDSSRVRNGIVIVKDKTGKLLAEQLQSAKAKKRDNVFDSFSDVGMWKVMPSPRPESTYDNTLKLRFSPQKPARLDSGVDSPCEKSKYMDIGVLKSHKLGNYSEDSDVFEGSPGVEKDSDPGLQNVNDSGIEILSSSSCNRSNGNSVRSVILDENSPSYFPTEDSLLSIDSPANENQLKTEHTVCVKCGGILMETNNNAQSPRKCRCSASLVNSPTQAPSPTKSGPSLPPQPQDHELSQIVEGDVKSVNKDKTTTENLKNSPSIIDIDDSDSNNSDIVMIDIEKDHKNDKISEFEDVEIIRDTNIIQNKSQSDLKLRLKLKPKKSVANDSEKKLDVSNSAYLDSGKKGVKCDTNLIDQQHLTPIEEKESTSENEKPSSPENWKSDSSENVKTSTPESEKEITLENKTENTPAIEKESSLEKVLEVQNPVQEKSESIGDTYFHQEKDSMCDLNELSTSDNVCVAVKDKNSSLIDSQKTEVKKKPLFKVKKSLKLSIHSKTNNIEAEESKNSSHLDNMKEIVSGFEENNCVRKKKPIFKKRSLSGDSDLGQKKNEDSLNRMDTQLITDTISSVSSEINDSKKQSHLSENKSNNLISSVQGKSLENEKLSKSNESIISNDTDQKVNITEESKVASNLVRTEDEDSLLQLAPADSELQENKCEIKSPVSIKSCTSPLDLFQQQFLSFLSSNKPVSKEDKTKNIPPIESTQVKKDKSIEQNEKIEFKQDKKTEKLKSNDSKDKSVRERNCELSVADENSIAKGKQVDISQVNTSTPQGKEKLSLRKLRTKQKTADKTKINKTSNKIASESQKVKSGGEDESKLDSLNISNEVTNIKEIVAKAPEQKDEFVTDVKCKQHDRFTTRSTKSTESRSDSLSWLQIFSDSLDNKNIKKDEKSPSEEVVDFTADLAAINKKMDVSDDELNALDVDDVFKSKNLSTLQPRVVQQRSVKRQKFQGGRPQKARRTIGKFKQKPKVSDSDSEKSDSTSNSGTIDLCYSNADQDPDFNPFHDSDGDFEIQTSKCKVSGRKRAKSKNMFEDSDSDFEEVDSKTPLSGDGKHVSRSKRLKQGQKSCCPCCLGSTEKSSRDHHHHKYKLPKNSKQFVNSSIKLLELQAKIHQLFLSLFPECAELISNSKIGTEEFELLIEEVLSSLESKEINFEGNSMDSHQAFVGKLYSCPSDSCNSLCNMSDPCVKGVNIDQTGLSVNDCFGASIGSLLLEKQAGIESQNEADNLSAVNISESDLIVDNRTSTHIDTQISNSFSGPDYSANDCHIHSAITQTSATIEQVPQASSVTDDNSVFYDQPPDLAESSSYPHTSEHGAIDSIESDITITIDLNAAKVSLCRDPKHCLERLQHRIPRLVHCLLPKLKLRKTFFKSMNNLHFLLDLMITSNLPGSNTNVLSDDEEEDIGRLKVENLTQEGDLSKIICVNTSPVTTRNTKPGEPFSRIVEEKSAIDLKIGQEKDVHTSPVERVPLLSKFQDMFEQEIKSHRESLKKDVFEVDMVTEKGDQNSLFKAKEVLTTISKFEKMNCVKQKLRPRRDPRLRKRSEAETRKLFVQEKIQNNQHSSIVCHSSPQKVNNSPIKSRQKRRFSQNSKESFLSKLNLGGNKRHDENSDKIDTDDVKEESDQIKSTDNVDNVKSLNDKHTADESQKLTDIEEKSVEEIVETSDTKSSADTLEEFSDKTEKEQSVSKTENSPEENTTYKTGNQEAEEGRTENPDTGESSVVSDDSESKQKSGEKNIFELMQPS